jgi:hypothetical protein
MSRSDGRGRVPFPQRDGSGQGRLGPVYVAVAWACDRCEATVTDRDAHDRFHAGLVELWKDRR